MYQDRWPLEKLGLVIQTWISSYSGSWKGMLVSPSPAWVTEQVQGQPANAMILCLIKMGVGLLFSDVPGVLGKGGSYSFRREHLQSLVFNISTCIMSALTVAYYRE